MRLTLISLMLVSVMLLPGCHDEAQKTAKNTAPADKPAAQAQAKAATEAAKPMEAFSGKVLEVIQTPNYTYARLGTTKTEQWVATTRMDLKKDADVMVPPGALVMTNYHSKSLDRTFDRLLFVDALVVAGQPVKSQAQGMPAGHPSMTPQKAKVEVPEIAKAEGGYTVAEIFQQRKELAGKVVAVRGMVVKYYPKIMGMNWVHLQDRSGDAAAGTNELIVTTGNETKTGQVVLVKGKVAVDFEAGHGMKMPVVLQEATLTPED